MTRSATKTITVDGCGGVAEICQLTGENTATVRRWIDRRESTRFPEPVLRLAMGDLYVLVEAQEWYASWCSTRRPKRRNGEDL
jgi:hypothetical protein